MAEFLPLEALGPRIMVMGPTNSGKSTLAEAMGRRTGLPVVHLDRLRHLPHTNWVERPDDEFKALHDEAVATDTWIMDGAYSKLMPPRVARVTGIVVLDASLLVRARRYFWRSMFQKRRAGGLDGDQDSVSWKMIDWLWKTRNKAGRTRAFARGIGVPCVFCHNTREVAQLYRQWGLER
jgi:adenylate kinase family enzyme